MPHSHPTISNKREIVQTLVTLMSDRSMPLWAREGWDADNGGFVERLDNEGKADQLAPRRVRVQARQIYSFATGALLGWFPQGRDIAIRGLDYLLAKAKSPDGQPGFVHLIDREGNVINPLRDTYDQAFVLLALATVYRLDRDAQVCSEMNALVAFLDGSLRSPHGGFVEGVPSTLPRRQNPQMHLFEAMIAAFEATNDRDYLTRAGDLFGLFNASLYDGQRQVLGEYFEEDWSKIEPVVVEPGHQAEWVWLLKQFERLTGCPTSRFREQLLSSALRLRDPRTGCLIDVGDADGRILKPTRRLWPQTEMCKAWIAQAEAGDDSATEEALDALLRLYRHYLSHPVQGGWYDQFDGNDRSLVDTIPASSFYHIVCAIAEAQRVLLPSLA
jgi:mannose/cellobiose epimerase-like protein (N-acyl-D-glucosamine 2-epimerase family)